MTAYLVERRMKEDRTYMPGEILVDPPFARIDLLRQRGYLVIVPDSYGPRASTATAAAEEYESRYGKTREPESTPTGGPEGANGDGAYEPSGSTGPEPAKLTERISFGAGSGSSVDSGVQPLPEAINLEAEVEAAAEDEPPAPIAIGGKTKATPKA